MISYQFYGLQNQYEFILLERDTMEKDIPVVLMKMKKLRPVPGEEWIVEPVAIGIAPSLMKIVQDNDLLNVFGLDTNYLYSFYNGILPGEFSHEDIVEDIILNSVFYKELRKIEWR